MLSGMCLNVRCGSSGAKYICMSYPLKLRYSKAICCVVANEVT